MELDHVRGLGDKFVGLGKELAGTVIGNEKLQEAGEAQQARGTESLKALRKQAKAQSKQAKAETFEQQEKAAQRAKSA
ncbi:MAG: CsbD family protein [Acidimicrobiia bacterium]|nr:CsbD family protein [Acidimicrobiia bacterium]